MHTLKSSRMRSLKKMIARFLRFFFHALYTNLSWAYDAVAYVSSVGQWRAWQRTGLCVLPPGESLEVGFGTGHLLRERASFGNFAVGIDISKQMTKITQRRLLKANSLVMIAQASTFHLPFPQSMFYSVLSTFPSDFIYRHETFQEIYRVLKPNGLMVIVPGVEKIGGAPSAGSILVRVLDKLSAWLYALTGEQINPGLDWKAELLQQLKDIGFTTTIESVPLERSVVLRIVAQKLPPKA